ncbi:four-carbon acid sugar kinase family protein [Marinitenerispora sediminis]|uniref:Hrp-dependent type III effector protein n=1 Tax=Marinitenerispora sediminis TaxID=1931232 RepID=A0A368TC41_9ACTN|nr:four-carbon acid sugar kinase family protein [Marinitenerispora sediminis]RCV58175.1 Hrp-dependent type III effector protein [Marinitenerispora sediminis]RCV61467.1 Hrp-dependent type III effector protein [Marinitenerispora sediminis]RCV62546.1 Hrp-dependent type III effector protein [Marinitenerispora sediminis]
MAQVLVVADDLTGANATGARFARAGMRVATVAPEHVTRAAQEYDVVVANLDSRHLPAEQAADLVTDVVEAVWPVDLVVKRTDTTLRGNVGAELEAAWRAVRERVPAGTRVRALMAPAFPASGRVTVDGVQLLDGVPLERTELAVDPLTPMTTSVVADIVAAQTDLAVRHVPIRQVTQTLLAADLSAGDEPVVLCDAFTEQHLADIAEAAAEVHRRDGTVWVAVDPGPTGALLADALRLRGGAGAAGPVLAVVGSATDLTRRQLDAVTRSGPVRFVDVDVIRFAHDDDHRDDVAAALTRHLDTAVFPELVVLRTATSANDVVELPAKTRRALPHLLAALVREVLDDVARRSGEHALPSGLFTSGGDVTSAVLDELDVHAFEVGGEVLPLAVHGTLSGGPLDGVPIVTKGGLIGDDTALIECFAKLRRAGQARLRQVRSEVSEHVLLVGGGVGD